MKKCVKKIIANSKHRELVYVISYCLFHSLEKVLHIPTLMIWWSLKSCTELNINLLLTIMKQNFLDSIAEYLFSKDVGESLKKVIFIVVLCDGSTDVSVTAGGCEH